MGIVRTNVKVQLWHRLVHRLTIQPGADDRNRIILPKSAFSDFLQLTTRVT